MLSGEKVMDVVVAYELTESYRAAAQLCGVDHHTVKRIVKAREMGLDPSVPVVPERTKKSDPFVEHIEGWVEKSKGQIAADVVHDKLSALGYDGSDRTTRRVVAAIKADWVRDNRRSYRPWLTEPGLWLQWDYGDGPVVNDQKAVLFCAWLAWARFRVVLPLADKKLPTVIAALDRTFRTIGGVPTHCLTDNEKTVTVDRVAGLAVRNSGMASAGVFYGTRIESCEPFDPESKGGSEATVRIAKADLVPTATNLRADYQSWDELEEACEAFCERVNSRVHRVTNRRPVDMLAEELPRLHRLPAEPYTIAFGQTRSVSWSSTIHFGGARYSVPHRFRDSRVWVRTSGDQIVIVADNGDGKHTEIARHAQVAKGHTSIVDEHYPPRKTDPANPKPAGKTDDEKAFLAIGDGAAQWLLEATANGVARIRHRMAEAVELADAYDPVRVDHALGLAATNCRFASGDLASIMASHIDWEPRRADGTVSLQPGTGIWATLEGLDRD